MGHLVFSPYWTETNKIDFYQRVILVHSYLYYIKDSPVWSDRKFDETAKYLVFLQKQKNVEYIKNKTQYGYVFYDFDGNTGFDLFERLKKSDKNMIAGIAERINNE